MHRFTGIKNLLHLLSSSWCLTFERASLKVQRYLSFLCQIAKPLTSLTIWKLHKVQQSNTVLGPSAIKQNKLAYTAC